MENIAYNPNLLTSILKYLDETTLIRAYLCNKKIKTNLEKPDMSLFWENYYKDRFPRLYNRIHRSNPEEKLLYPEKENDVYDWRIVLKETLDFKYSKKVKNIKKLEPQVPTIDDIEYFAARIANMHSWYKHNPNYPGLRYMISLVEYFRPNTFFVHRYEPAPSVKNPTNNRLFVIWKYEEIINKHIVKSFLENKLFSVYLNTYLSPRSNSNVNAEYTNTIKVKKEVTHMKGYDEYLKIRNSKEELLRQFEDIMQASIDLVYLIYDVEVVMRDYSFLTTHNDISSYVCSLSYDPEYLKLMKKE
jgi:hypothetical protein